MAMDRQSTGSWCGKVRMGYLPVLLVALVSLKDTTASPAMSVTLHGITDTLKPEYAKYADSLKTGEAAFIDAEKLFADFDTKEGWKKEGHHSGFSVHQKMMADGKITIVSAPLDGTVEEVMHETWGGIDGLSSWNPTISFAEIIAPLTDYSDIVYYGNNDILVIKGREFLTVRLYRPTATGYIMASRSIDLPEVKSKSGKIRANVILAASQFRADPSNPRKTLCDVVLQAELKGDLPKKMVEQSMPAVMALVTEQNIKHFKELAKYS
ncbi:hypothetical protein PMAYCL1PPCAC_17325 [Pristionchus mayeri]|uniref:START domain-containing protein n=1 Tax=Pristionchus mayeri TaxID=1317129 RepID=A0AAN5I0D4_9BILA|nr:hypothetical protein PMAYCL1PPCAC_17325 [Pristionchus mayeri]